MYTAALLLIWAGISGHLSGMTIVIGLLVTAVIVVRIITEEQFLRTRYPEYADYARRTRRIIPYLI
jgi:protein-S-isoprenylcysteine O-methyltransferase Ste14